MTNRFLMIISFFVGLQYCFPGMWLSDLTKSRYEVREKKSVKKVTLSFPLLAVFLSIIGLAA